MPFESDLQERIRELEDKNAVLSRQNIDLREKLGVKEDGGEDGGKKDAPMPEQGDVYLFFGSLHIIGDDGHGRDCVYKITERGVITRSIHSPQEVAFMGNGLAGRIVMKYDSDIILDVDDCHSVLNALEGCIATVRRVLIPCQRG